MSAAAKMLKDQPNLGAGDESLCLKDWIRTFDYAATSGRGYTLSPAAAFALLHTLVAGRERVRRLVRERNEARELIPHQAACRPRGSESRSE